MKILLFLLALMTSIQTFSQVEELDVVQVQDHHEGQGLIDFVSSAKTLKEKDLRKKIQPTLGDTLQNEAGVNSTTFGPNSSRPVLRGLDGARIRLLQNSLQILDASTQSVDHAIPIDPLIIDQIEIVRGPMGILYGASAVGGVVNILTNRIHSSFQEGKVIEVQSQGESVNHGFSNSLRMDYGKNNWMLHIDGSTKNLGDQRIPGYAHSKKERQTNPAPPEEKNKLNNSSNQQDSIGLGATRFFNRGHVGLAFNHFKTDYGTVADKAVTIEMQQNRFEFNGEYRPQSLPVKKISLKSAQTDYLHREIENSATGTIFENSGNETRLEAYNENGSVKGATGVQTDINRFEAQGDEAFLPEVENRIVSIFTFQEYKFGNNALSFGGRLENTEISKESSASFLGEDEFGFFGQNASGGYVYSLNRESSFSLSYSYTERAPTFQELLSNGAHVATDTFESGDTSLSKEKSHGTELGYKYLSTTASLNFAVYAQTFQNYVALKPTGVTDLASGLEIYQYDQTGAIIYGTDLDGKKQISKGKQGTLSVISKFDFIRGKDLRAKENLPRISPPRMTLGLEHLLKNFESDFDIQYVSDQTHLAPNERRTESYFLTNIGTQYSIMHETSQIDIFLRLRNIFDVEARNHVSFLKEKAPMPGRNIMVGIHWLL